MQTAHNDTQSSSPYSEGIDPEYAKKEAMDVYDEATRANEIIDAIGLTTFAELPIEPEIPGRIATEAERGQKLNALFHTAVPSETGEPLTLGEYLGRMRMGVSIAMSSLDNETAKALEYLANECHVELTAWVTLPDEQSYWTNPANVRQTVERARELLQWGNQRGIRFSRIGIDLELPLQVNRDLATGNTKQAITELRKMWREKAEERKKFGDPIKMLQALVADCRQHGCEVEGYYPILPFVAILLGQIRDLEWLHGNVVQMAYTSPYPPKLRSFFMKYVRNHKYMPAIGIYSHQQKGGMPGRVFNPKAVAENLPRNEVIDETEILLRELAKSGKLTPRSGNASDIHKNRIYLFALDDPSVAKDFYNALVIAAGRVASQ